MEDVSAKASEDNIVEAAKKGDVLHVKFLIEKGVDVDTDNGEALLWAAMRGHREVVELLLEAEANVFFTNDNGSTAAQLARYHAHRDIEALIKERQQRDEITLKRRVSDSILEEVFNFKSLERITLLRAVDGGEAVSFQRDSFSALEDSALRSAFNQHVKRGGKTDESRVFTSKISKPRIS